MTQFSTSEAEPRQAAKLSRRDWILLPLVGVFTICLIAGSVELIARHAFSESKKGLASCFVMNDPSTGVRGIPNSVCWDKGTETGWIETRFNSCGYRAGMECGPKPAGTYRIVMTGSSIALGERVQRQDSLAALLPQDLSQQTGRKIELYNEGMGFGFSHNTALRFKDVLAAQPDMVLWLLTPSDVEGSQFVLPTMDLVKYNNQGLTTKAWIRIKNNFASKSFASAASSVFDRTRTALMLRYYLYQSQSQYVKFYLMGSADLTDFLKDQPSPGWPIRMQQLDKDASDMEARSKAAGVPFVAVYLPNRVQSAMISMGQWPQGFDPYKMDSDLRTIITSHGGTYLEILPDFRTIPNPERYYLPVDGHPNADGHALFARLIAKAMTSGPDPLFAPGFAPGDQANAAPGQGR